MRSAGDTKPPLRPEFERIEEVVPINRGRSQKRGDSRSLRNEAPSNRSVDIRFHDDDWGYRAQARGLICDGDRAGKLVRRLQRVSNRRRANHRVGFAPDFRRPLRTVAKLMNS